jgi:hypothetical protein
MSTVARELREVAIFWLRCTFCGRRWWTRDRGEPCSAPSGTGLCGGHGEPRGLEYAWVEEL